MNKHHVMPLLVKPEEAEKLRIEAYTLPTINLTDRQLFDLELLLVGGFTPLYGFMREEDYKEVVENMRLKSGEVWPIPIVLDVSKNQKFSEGQRITLSDKYGHPLAIMKIESLFSLDKNKEAEMVYGKNDLAHPGVHYLFSHTKNSCIGGPVIGFDLLQKYDFVDFRKTPEEIRKLFEKDGVEKIVGFQTRNPIHKAHYTLIKKVAEKHEAKVLIHPVIGLTKSGDIDYTPRVRSYITLYENYVKDFAYLSLLPLAMRMAGPREALWHALIRRNYGCTHFIVGRDHAGPGNDSDGKPFYGIYEAQKLLVDFEKEIDIKIIPMEEIVYAENENRHISLGEVKEHHKIKNISGTEFRKLLLDNEPIPPWFSFPEVIDELKKSKQFKKQKGLVIFFTGLSGSGKSTIANILRDKLLNLEEREITYLDGDVVRQNLSHGLGFSKEDRNRNIERIGFVASEVAKHGGIAICAAIAPYEESRINNRNLVSENGTYIEVYVETPIDECKRRDTKGLYSKAEKGLIKGVTGIDDPYEIPQKPELKIKTVEHSPLESANVIFDYLKNKKLL
jgi:sulfate adenylyltransferase